MGHSDSDSASYKPVVTYTYEVGGRPYTCKRVTPLDEGGGRAWAHRIVNSYKAGQTCEAYYDPGNPANAFLLRQIRFSPYMAVLFPMLFLAVAGGIVFGTNVMRGRSVPAPRARSDRWLEVQPVASIGRRIRTWTYLALGWYGLGALALGHYFHYAARPYETMSIVVAGLYGALGLAFAIPAVYFRLLGRNVDDARVLISDALIRCGGEITVRVQQTVLTQLHIEELKLGLICEMLTKTKNSEGTSYGTVTCRQTWATLIETRSTRRREVLSGMCKLSLSEDVNPSSPSDFRGYPFYRWFLRVVTRIADSPDYQGDFAIFVSAPQAVATAGS